MNELPVWVGGKEKIVGGLNRHTRCEDVIGILLQDRYKLSKCELSPQNLECYALFEKWRGCERQLSPRTRMYKLWKAWGAERDNVKFTLRKSVAMARRRNSLDSEVDGESGGIKLRDKAKRAANRQGQYNVKEGIVAYDLKKKKDVNTNQVFKDAGKGSKDKRRRSWADESDVGFSDVRILCPPPLDCDSSASTSSSSGKVTADGPTTLAEEVEEKAKLPIGESGPEALVQTILKQSHQLQSLLETVGSVDKEIELYETSLHHMRIQKDGQNYVQEAYLPGTSRPGQVTGNRKNTDSDIRQVTNTVKQVSFADEIRNGRDVRRVPPTPDEMVRDLEEYLSLCDRLFSVDDQLRHKQDAISNLSHELSNQRTSPQNTPSIANVNAIPRRVEKKRVKFSTSPNLERKQPPKDIGFARVQVELSAETSIAQRKELDRLLEQIEVTECAYKDKNHRLHALTDEFEQLTSDDQETSLEYVSSRDTSREDDADDEVSQCVMDSSLSEPVDIRCHGISSKNSSLESSLDQGIGTDFSPIDMTNRKSPSRSCDTDSSSDTGLSSLHSQDESDQIVYNISETLV